jgi:CheY-like chemotaxis protein
MFRDKGSLMDMVGYSQISLHGENPLKMNEWVIVIAEDEFDSLQTLSKILQYHDIQIFVSRNGKECLRLLEEVRPHAVIVDLAMPEMDGWETLAHIRANEMTAHVPVVAVTAYYSIEVAEDAFQAGFDGYFAKPVSPVTFVRDLATIIQKKS